MKNYEKEKDIDYFSSADKLTLTGKLKEGAWRKPTMKFGFQDYNPVITIYFNREEPITREDWQSNILSVPFDLNGFFIFIESCKDIIESKGEVSFLTHITGTKKVNGTYMVGETETKGIISFGKISSGKVYIEMEDVIGRKDKFYFDKPFRSSFVSNGLPFDEGKLSCKYAKGQMEHWSKLAVMYHEKYITLKNKRSNR